MSDFDELKRKIDTLTEGCLFGIYAYDTKSGFSFTYNATTVFEMASTFKIPIAIHALRQVAANILSLNQELTLVPSDQRPGTGLPKPLISDTDKSKTYTLRELITLMLQYSDNTATDAVLRMIGGPSAVMQTVRGLDVNDLRVDTNAYDFFTQQIGVGHLLSESTFSIEAFTKLEASLDPAYLQRQITQYEALQYNTATPSAMGELLLKLVQGNILSLEHRTWLLEVMAGCKTFPGRIPALLPRGLKISRKTGSLSHVANDVAILDLPDGPVILVIFSKKVFRQPVEKDRMVAQVAQAIFAEVIATRGLANASHKPQA